MMPCHILQLTNASSKNPLITDVLEKIEDNSFRGIQSSSDVMIKTDKKREGRGGMGANSVINHSVN